jgi:5-methylcytosine-specific restriction endonuclease McrA
VKRTGLKRKTELKRGNSRLKRSRIERKVSLPPRSRAGQYDISRRYFKDTELHCRNPNCTKKGKHDHHVVFAQEVRKREPSKEWDARNALKLCVECHRLTHKPGPKFFRTVWLRDSNIEFAFELMGDWAAVYLRRKYDDVSEPDPRIADYERRTLEVA